MLQKGAQCCNQKDSFRLFTHNSIFTYYSLIIKEAPLGRFTERNANSTI